ncbi:MAG TPA: hypothetical protein VHT51_18765 [Micropepsaceae bacterium]|jgi:multisubunit Na+/H+ antiporter MnhC subunit|nr:hypothetical protein [Micropepsaceae bacterium]
MGRTDQDKIKMLFDYTVFHIGIYMTLATLLVSFLAAELSQKIIALRISHEGVIAAIVFIGMAGIAGGVIASSLPESDSLTSFLQKKTGPWDTALLSGRGWTRLEHTSFWLGVVVAAITFASAKPT